MGFIGVIVCVLFALLFVALLRMGNQFDTDWTKRYPAIDYHESSQASIDPWRWRQPNHDIRIPYDTENRLGIKNLPGVSRFVFRREFRLAEATIQLVGVVLIGVALFRMVLQPFWLFQLGVIPIAALRSSLLAALFLFSLGFLLLQCGNRVQQIDLYPDRVGIVTQAAFFLRRTKIYQRHQFLRVHGKTQLFWQMERGQIQPDYKITIERSRLGPFSVSQTFSLHCNPTQGSWIVGGLNHWRSLPTRHSAKHHGRTEG